MLLRHWIHCRKKPVIFPPSRIIIHIQPITSIKLLIIILIGLQSRRNSIRKRSPERTILRALNYRCRRISHYPVVTQMVVDVKVIISAFNIPAINQNTPLRCSTGIIFCLFVNDAAYIGGV